MFYCQVSCLKVLCSPFFSLLLSSISESFLTVKGAALFLPRGNGSSPSSASRFSQLRSKHAGEVTGQQGETGRLAASHVSLTLIRVVFLFLRKETSSSIYKPCSRSSDRRTTSNWCVNTFTQILKSSIDFQDDQLCFILLIQAVRLESANTQIIRYMVVVSTNGRQDTEESVVLGMDFSPVDR